ncbi:MAG: PilN domain-containing protein [Candidatus Saccharimonadales bacterium]
MAEVQFNLLPNVKLDYLKAEHSKRRVFVISVIVAAVAFAIFLVTFVTVDIIQKKQLTNADNTATTTTQQLKGMAGLAQIVTVQNQLQTLSTLHHNKHATGRLFNYLTQTTPSDVKIGSLSLDFSTNTLAISGTASTQAAVNTFIDTLKFTTYKIGSQANSLNAFTSVQESSFSIATNSVNYSLNVQFDPQLFSSNVPAVPKLSVPSLTTTRSVIGDPNNNLFNGSGSTEGQ